MDDANKYVLRQRIASALDHPSVFMGGPSQQSVRKAIRIVEMLTQDYEIAPGLNDESAAVNVRTWRTSPWDSFDRT